MFEARIKKTIVRAFQLIFLGGHLTREVTAYTNEFLGEDFKSNEIREVIIEAVAISFEKRLAEQVAKYINSEAFIDRIVERIVRKQLLFGGRYTCDGKAVNE